MRFSLFAANGIKNIPPVIKTEGFIYYSSLLLCSFSFTLLPVQHRDLYRSSRPVPVQAAYGGKPKRPSYSLPGVKRQPCPLTPTALRRPMKRKPPQKKQRLTPRFLRRRKRLALRLQAPGRPLTDRPGHPSAQANFFRRCPVPFAATITATAISSCLSATPGRTRRINFLCLV